jgi:capsular polysaccharide biosynthesis protein
LLYHLPKIMVLQDVGAEGGVLIPGEGRLRPVIEASLEALGMSPSTLRSASASAMRADPLWIVEADRFDPDLLTELRRRIVGDEVTASRRVYVSRQRAMKRRLANAREVSAPLEAAGFELVEAEDLTFQAQVALAAQTRVLVAVHGAGLTNMVFMRRGTHVVELANPRYPSPAFYALASALGLRYWLIWGKPRAGRGPESLDLEVDPHELERVIAAIESEAG